MSQKSTHGWIIVNVFWFFFWSIISFVAVLMLYPMLIEMTFIVVFWVSGILGLVVVLAFMNKYPSLRSVARSFVLIMVVFTLLDGAMYGFVAPQLYNLNNPHFRILDINYTSQYSTGYTFYARIHNDGIDGMEVVTCVVTKADLNTVSKSQTVYLRHNEQESISFYFSVAQVGTDWEKYRIELGLLT